jgi:ABC-2 type transport system ATP-binding protein
MTNAVLSAASSASADEPFADAHSSVVAIDGLRVTYGRKTVLDGLRWRLPAGQVVGLLGRNGAGKTTLIEALLGLCEPQAGEVRLFGRPLAQLGDAERGRIGYVPQQSELFEWLTPAQLLAYFRSFYPRWNTAKAEGLLSRWQIDPHTLIGQLSGGQKQRLSIVRALAHEPELLVFDEPVASLDPAGRRDFLRELVEQVIDRRSTVLFSTHILSDLERVAFDVAFLREGRIALQAPLDELLERTRRVIGPAAEVDALCRRLGLQPLRRNPLDGGRIALIVQGGEQALQAAGAAVGVEAVTLEDLFMEFTR